MRAPAGSWAGMKETHLAYERASFARNCSVRHRSSSMHWMHERITRHLDDPANSTSAVCNDGTQPEQDGGNLRLSCITGFTRGRQGARGVDRKSRSRDDHC
jgi:hypothetical protein